MPTPIAANDITLKYSRDAPEVLKQFSLPVRAGEMVGVLGPNGSGKSTLIRALSRTLRPTSGSVVLSDADLYEKVTARDAAREIGTVPQNATVAFEFTVRDVVEMGRTPRMGRGLFAALSSRDAEIVDEAMQAVGVAEFAGRPMTALSGGEQQRVLLARALAQEPGIILLDEPTASLDIRHQAEVLGLIRRLAKGGKAVLAVLHDLNLGATYCDKLVLLKDGRIAAQGTPAEVLTAEHIAEVYGARVWVRCHPTSGRPLVLSMPEPLVFEPPSPTPHADGGPPFTVHVICGGGTGAGLMVALLSQGFAVTAGALNMGDTDQEAAAMLGIQYVPEAPFSALSEDVRAKAEALAAKADVILLTDVPFGLANLPNLEIAAAQRTSGKPVVCVQPSSEEFAVRDFTGGEAARIWEALRESGARIVSDPEEVFSTLRESEIHGG